MSSNKVEMWQLQQRQGLPLSVKERYSERRISAWYGRWNGNVYVSFSGGKDSTVLLHLVRNLYPDVPAVFVDTGLEYPEIIEFVRTIDNVVWLKPKMSFFSVLQKYGYPVISKMQAQYIECYRMTGSEKMKDLRWNGKKYNGHLNYKISEKWKYLVTAPFKISDKCCDVMKKSPVREYEKATRQKPFIGIMAVDSIQRKKQYLQQGCNVLEGKNQQSRPMAFWLEQDIWDYIKKCNIPYSKIYDMGQTHTGCMFCMFGVHIGKGENRFQKMKKTHPKKYEYCINILGCGQVLDYIGVKY